MNLCRGLLIFGLLIAWTGAGFAQEILLSFDDSDAPGVVPPPRDANEPSPTNNTPPNRIPIPNAAPTPNAPSPGNAPVPGSTLIMPAQPEMWPQSFEPAYGYAPEMYAPDMPVYAPSCPWWRPCGPGNTWGGNLLFRQGAYGADFRFACANHDACLMNHCNSRYFCDRQFYEQMCAACMMSDNPAACMHAAHKYYVLVRVFGVFYRK